jgi:threonine dehydrogenase-like Zn-dependent dehydrogenase
MIRALYVEKRLLRIAATRALRHAWPGVVFSRISPLRFGKLPAERLPGPNWVRVANKQCGICGTDLTLACVAVDPTIAPAALPGTDRIYLGHEVVGVVVEAGSAVTKVAVGDRVVMDTRFQGPTCLSRTITPPCVHCRSGNYMLCEYAARQEGPVGIGGGWSDEFTCHESEVFRLPNDLNDDDGMFVEPLSTGVRSVLRAAPNASEKILVYGAGVVGLNIVQCLRALVPGCSVTVIARHDHQARLAHLLGAHEVLRESEPHDAIARITGGKLFRGFFGSYFLLGGFEVIYDCVGSAASLKRCLRWARARGTVVMVGIDMHPLRLDLSPIWHQEVDLIGVIAHGAERIDDHTSHTYDVAIDLLRRGAVRVTPLITHRFRLADWRLAIEVARNKEETRSVKVVLDVQT